MSADERDFWYREGRTPVVRHMADRSYTIRAWISDEADTAEFEIYKVVAAVFFGEDAVEGPAPGYWQRLNSRVSPSAVDSLEEAARIFLGGVKNTGCADWDLKGDQILDFHICEREHLEAISAVLCACQDWAPKLIRDWYGKRPDRELPFLPEE